MSNQDDKERIIKCKIRLSKQLFPKEELIVSGNFGIISAYVLDVVEGEPIINKYGTITLTGIMCTINDDEIYKVVAKEVNNNKYGIQYEIIYIGTIIKLETREDQYKFLEKVLTEKQCIALFDTFKNPIKILENQDVKSLCEIKGIGVSTAQSLIKKYLDNKDYSEIYIELDKYGLSRNTIIKLVNTYGSPNIVIDKIKQNPYLLIDEVEGIGWEKADELALKSGISEYSTIRTQAYIKYYLHCEALKGHTWCYMDDLLDAIDATIGYELSQDILVEALKELKNKEQIWTNDDQDIIALMENYNLEKNIANEIVRLNNSNNDFNIDDWKQKINSLEREQGWNFTQEQIMGIETILNHQITIIQGGAGSGKSSTVSGILEIFKDNYIFAQTALSGRASCNLTDITGAEGYTIHRLLGYLPNTGFLYNKKHKMNTDIIILDELSMVGANIFYKLLQAIKNGAKLIMLGDIGQLEAIGVGNVMMDMINSGYVKCVELTKIHRQAKKSAIITESKKVREQKQIIDNKWYGSEIRGTLQDLELDIYQYKDTTHDRVIAHFKELLKKVDDPFDIQVIVPVKKRGNASAYSLSNSIQELIIDKSKKGLTIGANSKTPYTIYIGDKVINHRNNYKTVNDMGMIVPIFNGDLGIVKDIDYMNQALIIDFNTKGEIYISKDHLLYIKLGYAITTHKLQGSSSPYVICGLDYSHYKLLNKEMVYTMLTRAKKYCVLCAENKALRFACSNSEVKTKRTFLEQLLKFELNKTKQLK